MRVFKGVVEEGSKRARLLGYPTVNIGAPEAPSGIYAAQVIFEGKAYPAAAFSDPLRKILEAYLLDFSQDLYGQEIAIELHEKIRESAEYGSDDDLKRAIAEDVARVREYFHL